MRSNLVVALGDLASRWPNTLEPWTTHMYAPLADAHEGVRHTACLVTTHLILADILKACARTRPCLAAAGREASAPSCGAWCAAVCHPPFF